MIELRFDIVKLESENYYNLSVNNSVVKRQMKSVEEVNKEIKKYLRLVFRESLK